MKPYSFRLLSLAGAAALMLGSFAPIRAQDADDLQRGVARISLINGEVSVRRGDSGEWVAAAINAPLMTEDRISTGPNSRAEVQFDAANVLRVGGNAEVRLTQLEYNRYQMEVARGTVNWDVLRPSTINVELDTPSVSVRPSKQGSYRVAVSENGETMVTARAGEVEVFTPRGSQWVNSGQMLMARGGAGDAEFQIVNANPLDDWDRWNQTRDRAMTQTTSYQYVPQGVYGVEDLDNYGSWQNIEPYGMSWRPRYVDTDWSPYSQGRWGWEDWYGYTWISYDPWGWAPYHYGRWFHEPRYGWCWYPGAYGGGRSYWSPALVAFFGYGRGGGFGFGFGNVGWVPLAPHENFNRWWGRGYYHNGGNFNRNINITNVNIANNYRNAQVRNGISGVSAGDFSGGRFNRVSHVSGDQVRDAGLVRGQVPIAPTNSHLRFSDRAVTNVPRSNDSTRFFTHQQPNRVDRVPFAQQQRGAEQGTRTAERPDRGSLGGGNAPNAPRGAAPENGFRGQQPRQAQPGSAVTPSAPRNSGGESWRKFGEPGGQTARPNSPQAPQGGQNPNQGSPNRGAWGRFGDPGNRPSSEQSRRAAPEAPANAGPRGDQPMRMAPPVVRERQDFSPRQSSPQNSPQPRYSAPQESAPRSFGRPSYSPPARQSEPRSYSAPQYNPPARQSEPRSYSQPSRPSPAPSYSTPSYSAPRGGGGGGMSAPRQSGGGGGSTPRGNSGGGESRGNGGSHGGGRR